MGERGDGGGGRDMGEGEGRGERDMGEGGGDRGDGEMGEGKGEIGESSAQKTQIKCDYLLLLVLVSEMVCKYTCCRMGGWFWFSLAENQLVVIVTCW